MHLIDTNVLVYAYDRVEPQKRIRSRELLDALSERDTGALSAQVLGEFYNAVTRKIRSRLTATEASRTVSNLVRSWTVYPITPAAVVEATLGAGRHQLSYWDALLWSTAKLQGAGFILSEDFSHGRLIEGVRILNPYHASFDVNAVIPR